MARTQASDDEAEVAVKVFRMAQLQTRSSVVSVLGGSLLIAVLGCRGEIAGAEPSAAPGGTATPPIEMAPSSDPALVTGPLGRGATGISRLSRSEYESTVTALLGLGPGQDLELLPPDSFSPFDNNYTLQSPSKVLVDGLKTVAERLTERVLADPARVAALLGCTPTGRTDAECFRSFIARFGRQVLRRPLAPNEIDEYATFLDFALESGDFSTALGMALRALLQDMEFVYRFEIGSAAPDTTAVIALTDYEIASRLSFFLWGRAPDEDLLDAAENGGLATADGLRQAATRLLDAPDGLRRLQRFHAQWLGYETLPHDPTLNAAMRQETDALVERVIVLEQGSWLELFTHAETFVDPQLAELYGLAPSSAGAAWTAYSTPARRGLLSHAAVLSNGVKAGDTSPTLRGKFVLERLLCQPVPPPPANVAADEPPMDVAGRNCKVDRYAAHAQGACAACHSVMDGLGFGLENYDALGRYRGVEEADPACTIEGVGTVPDLGTFSGPAELGALLVGSGRLEVCLAQHLYQLALGRAPGVDDQVNLDSIVAQLASRGTRLRDLILDWVSHDSFRYRAVDAVQ